MEQKLVEKIIVINGCYFCLKDNILSPRYNLTEAEKENAENYEIDKI
jgi:hypothetical protein